MKRISAIYLMVTTLVIQAAPFRNLDFEGVITTNRLTVGQSPPIFPYVGGSGPTEDLMPGWSLSANGIPVATMLYNLTPIGSFTFGITTRENEFISDFYFERRNFPQGFEGKYGIYVNAPSGSWAITQRGDIPADATRMTLHAWIPQGMSLETRMNGKLVENGDISEFTGQNVEMQMVFYKSGEPFSFEGANIGLDRIEFIPEPGTWALFLAGGGLMAVYSRLRARQKPGVKLR